MSLRLILGRSGSGKTTICLDEIKGKLMENPKGAPIIYLVPEQMTFQSEYKLIRSKEIQGMVRAQVFSFTRLAWRVLQETGGLARYHLNQTGLHMLLVKVLEREKEHLKIFSSSAEASGFIDKLEEMLAEFKRYAVSLDTLRNKRETLLAKGELAPYERLLADKLHDFQLVFQKVEEELADRYVHGEDYLRLLAEKIPTVSWMAEAEIYVDGFHSFSPQERLVLKAMLSTAKRVTLTLTLDKVPESNPDELDLFYMTGTTCRQVIILAQEADCKVERPLVLVDGHRFVYPDLAHLERYYDTYPPPDYPEAEHVQLIAGTSRRAEVEAVAREMIRLARDEGYRWRDMAILIRNQDDYQPLLETIFSDYEIPFFLDGKRPMLHHPLVELIRSSMDIIRGHWRYEAVIRCLKTELLFPLHGDREVLREGIDRLENVALAYGIQGARWFREEPWRYRHESGLEQEITSGGKEQLQIEKELNQLRLMLVKPLVQLEQEMNQARTIQDRCTVLYRFLEYIEAPLKLEQLREDALERGDLLKAQEHSQVWEAVCELLDQMVEFAGEESLPLDLFVKMVETGLESMRFAQVPPAMDQVLVARLEHSRLTDIKCTFVLGVNEGVIPAKPREEGILTEEERGWLAEQGVELAPGSREQLLNEQFLIYLAFSSPSERLYISYALADDEGETLLPSLVVKRIKDMYPDAPEILASEEPLEGDEASQLAYVTHPSKTLSALAVKLQSAKRGYPLHPLWWDVYNWIMDQPAWKERGLKILSSLFYRNQLKRLDPSISRSLYGAKLRLSVSRMELFQACPFSHFASYGLKLFERQVYRLEAPDIGQLFHAALNMIASELAKQGLGWDALNEETCFELAHQVVERLAPAIQREILFSTNRYQYMKNKLEKVVGRASFILSEQAKRSGFSPVGLEVGFGPEGPLPPLTFTLKNGVTLEVVGRIDRVDRAESSQGTLLRIIDYKSSAKALNLAEVYFGLALQLLVYLDVVLTHAETWLGTKAHPAGVLYFHVHNPLHQAKRRLSKEEIDRELFKKFKMKGLLLADPEAVQLMDSSLKTGYSQIVPVGLKRDGGFYSNSSVIDQEDFDHVRRFAREKIVEIGQKLVEGEVAVNPYKLKQRTPCIWCAYRPVCQFDPVYDTNGYRILSVVSRDEILDKIRRR
jgi:ATP-dependent helicase/nuclease subunit B